MQTKKSKNEKFLKSRVLSHIRYKESTKHKEQDKYILHRCQISYQKHPPLHN